MKKHSLFLLLACLTASGVSTIVRKSILQRMEPLKFEVIAGTLHFFLAAAACALVHKNVTHVPIDNSTIALILLQGLLSFLAVTCFNFSVKESDLSTVIALTSAAPFVTTLVASIAFGEKISPQTMFGMLLILCGAAVVASK
jgi:drug/metabolite transporter (DMT)-like permease